MLKNKNPRIRKIRLFILSHRIPIGWTRISLVKDDAATIIPKNSYDAPRFNASKGTVGKVMLLLRSDRKAKIANIKMVLGSPKTEKRVFILII